MALYKRLIAASPKIEKARLKTRAEILSSILLLRLFLIVIAIPTFLAEAPQMTNILGYVMAANLAAYLISRTEHFGWGAAIIITETLIITPLRVFSESPISHATLLSSIWLASGPIISSLVLPKKATVLFVVITVAEIFAMIHFLPNEHAEHFVNVLTFVLSTSFLVLLGSTLRENAEVQLEVERVKSIHAAKMASLGEMASGVAHEINNPLSIVKAKSEKILRLLEQNAERELIVAEVAKILSTSNRIAVTIKGMNTFSRDASRDSYETCNAVSLISDTMALCAEKFKFKDVALRFEVYSECFLECRGTQISQIILNLLNNALDAVEVLEERWVKIEMHASDTDVIVTVTDSGKGVTDEVAEKLMQPFFTTKGVGKGTGLGLSISTGIARSHSGSLKLDRASENTKFVLTLPRKQSAGLEKAA